MGPGCQSTTQQLSHQNACRFRLLCFLFILTCRLCLLPFALLSFHFRKQLFLHKLQSHSQQHVRQTQTAWGCPRTFYFIFPQSQHGLPGTTSVAVLESVLVVGPAMLQSAHWYPGHWQGGQVLWSCATLPAAGSPLTPSEALRSTVSQVPVCAITVRWARSFRKMNSLLGMKLIQWGGKCGTLSHGLLWNSF